MFSLKPDSRVNVEKIRIRTGKGRIPALVVSSEKKASDAPGVLWIHGGGYFLGMKEMIYMSRAIDLVTECGAVVISPGYHLAFLKPYPAAINECYSALKYLEENAEKLGIDRNRIMVGGESAGGGLCAALCMMARDRGEVNIAFQMPLYPMLDNFDTESSKNNHGRIWNTKRNHFGWKMYLRKDAKSVVSPYASPARQTDYSSLPPAYTFVGRGEPFYSETLKYISELNKAGVEAEADVYESNMHAFDMLKPELEISKEASEKFIKEFRYAAGHYTAKNSES